MYDSSSTAGCQSKVSAEGERPSQEQRSQVIYDTSQQHPKQLCKNTIINNKRGVRESGECSIADAGLPQTSSLWIWWEGWSRWWRAMHIEMNRMWMDGTVGAWPLSGVLGSSVEFILWKTPLISAKYITLFTLKMECKAQHKGMKPEYVCKNRGYSVIYRCRDQKEQYCHSRNSFISSSGWHMWAFSSCQASRNTPVIDRFNSWRSARSETQPLCVDYAGNISHVKCFSSPARTALSLQSDVQISSRRCVSYCTGCWTWR